MMKAEQMSSNKYNYMESSSFDECNSNPIDLSRRRDSVETRKTPSPYNSSNFGSSSPSNATDSPSTATISSSNGNPLLNQTRDRSDTPTHHYQNNNNNNFIQHFRQTNGAFFPYQSKRESPSPPDNITNMRQMQEYTAVAAAAVGQTPEELNPYILHAMALQQKIVQSQLTERPSSNDSSSMISLNIPATITPTPIVPPKTVYPMILGRDGKLSRPFKAYPRDPLSITTTINESLLDHTSAEKFTAFRKQMLDQIHAANGGHPTISNPKMKRTSARSFVENMTNITEAKEEHKAELEAQQAQMQQSDAHQSDSSSSDRTNSKMSAAKDSAYYERRKKNNAAAKKSRDRRRIKEDEIAIRAAYLERENIELKIELAAIKRQLSKYIAT